MHDESNSSEGFVRKTNPTVRDVEILTDKTAVLLLIFIIFGLFVGNIITGTYPVDPFWVEMAQMHMPLKVLYRDAFLDGHFPLWNPYVGMGYPSPSHSHSSLFYPLSWLFYFDDFLPSVIPFLIVHLSILGISTYWLLRELNSRPAGSFIGAACMTIVGFSFTTYGFFSLFVTYTWISLALLMVVKVIGDLRIKWVLGLAAVTAIQVLAGDVEMIFYQWVFIGLFVCLSWMFNVERWKLNVKSGFAIIVAFAIAGVLACIQLIPLVELLGQSDRTMGWERVPWRGNLRMVAMEYLMWLMRLMIRARAGFHIYNLGFLALAFGFYGWLKADKGKRRVLGLLLLFCFVNSILFFSPLLKLLSHFPVLKGFRFPYRFMVLAQLSVCIPVAWGVDRVLENSSKGAPLPLWFPIGCVLYGLCSFLVLNKWPFEFILAVSIVAVGLILLGFRSKIATPGLIYCAILVVLAVDMFAPSMKYLPRNSADMMSPYPEVGKLIEQNNELGPTAFSRSLIYAHEMDGRFITGIEPAWKAYTPGYPGSVLSKRYSRFFDLLVPGAFDFDEKTDEFIAIHMFYTYFFDRDFLEQDSLPWYDLIGLKYIMVRDHNLKYSSPFSLLYEVLQGNVESDGKPELLKTAKGDAISIRPGKSIKFKLDMYGDGKLSLKVASGDELAEFPVNVSVFMEKNVAGGELDRVEIHSFTLHSSTEEVDIEVDLPYDPLAGEVKLSLESKVTGVSSQKGRILYIEPEIEYENAHFKRIVHNNDVDNVVDIYDNPGAYPRAFLTSGIKLMENYRESFKFMRENPRFDYKKTVILEPHGHDLKPSPPLDENLSSTPEIQRYGDDIVEIDVQASAHSYLVLTDTYYIGWRAYLDGVEARVYPAYGSFRALEIPKGDHRVVFRFESEAFRLGLWGSLVSWFCAICILGLVSYSRRFNR